MQFFNNTELPITVSSWMKKSTGLSQYIDTTILPNTIVTVYSDVDEWIIGSIFYKKEFDDKWKKENLPQLSRLAKFTNKSSISGNYTWNFIESHFVLEYKDNIVSWSRIDNTR